MKHLIAPSVLSADFSNLQKDVEMINESSADWIHCDIMDGVFVPNISFGFPVLAAIAKHSKKPLDVHLMITDPNRYLADCKKSGAEVLTVHAEVCTHLHSTVTAIKKLGCKAGVALNPHTPVHVLEDIIEYVDLVLIMSVNPGFGGQQFIDNTYNKLHKLKALSASRNPDLLIEVDGGVNANNALPLLQAGANVLVAGNFVFTSNDPKHTIAELKAISPEIHQALNA